ncbi:MAG: YqhA family protein [Deltaproteobacteria bacterium]|jgi:uncharacterized membrane protein YqhA|nr:YqhA family protein [Deltaproteobacteria bacterium]MBW2588214.1 YqhA family protein [Deltaproteobacteria bacterium]
MARFLAACRFLLVIPVVGCVLLTAGVVIMGIGRIVTAGAQLFQVGDFSAKASKTMSLAVIEIIDLFLVGTVAYIAGIGIYKLFISNAEIELPMRLKINTLKDLEDKIIGVIVAALAVAFLGQAANATEPETLLSYGAGIALVIAALGFFVRHVGDGQPSDDD